MHYQCMVVYKDGEPIIGGTIAGNFRGHVFVSSTKLGNRKIYVPHWKYKRYQVGSKAHTLPLSQSGPVGPERKYENLQKQHNSSPKECKNCRKQRLRDVKIISETHRD